MSVALPALPQAQTRNLKQRKQVSAHIGSKASPEQAPPSPDSKNHVPATQSICLELLVQGHIHSYIDFFNLLIPVQTQSPGKPHPSKPPPLQDLQRLKTLLTTCELAIRSTDRVQIYTAKRALGFFYKENSLMEMAILYLREALECAKGIHANKMFEMEAAHSLGLVLASMGHAQEALKLYEQSRSLASEKGDVAAEQLASKSLVAARILIAQEYEKDGDFKEAITQYVNSIHIIEKSTPDEKVVNDLNYCLGNAYKQDHQVDVAVEYLNKYLGKCQELEDPVSGGKAQLALASCYESSGNLEEATEHLKQFIDATESDPAQKTSLAQACNQIGVLYNKLGDFPKAVTYFDRHFALACEINNEQKILLQKQESAISSDASQSGTVSVSTTHSTKGLSVGSAQIQLGLSKANANMAEFFKHVVDAGYDPKGESFAALLRWKATRSFEAADK
ncbi:Tetratricopeptide repeat protein 29 [Chytriomyces hyalinus]|nr:Tetratricopeptide repeat protein 29 [Chytriomyces hyalinus]